MALALLSHGKNLKGYEEKAFEQRSEYVESISNIDVRTVPDNYTVKTGDTFESIAQSQYGDRNFGFMIAEGMATRRTRRRPRRRS